MGFGQAVTTCLSRYATFYGRASRSEFWWFFLFFILMSVAATIVGILAFPANRLAVEMVTGIVELFLVLPMLAVGARRLHDIGWSGWWQLLYLTVVGYPVLVVLWVLSSEPARNAHGAPAAGGHF